MSTRNVCDLFTLFCGGDEDDEVITNVFTKSCRPSTIFLFSKHMILEFQNMRYNYCRLDILKKYIKVLPIMN